MGAMDGSLKKMVALLKSVDHGSFSGAAAAMSYTPSAVSRMIGELEAEWNVTLLERGRSGVSLTPAGLELLPYVRNICDGYDTLDDKISDLDDLRAGKIRIATISSVATHVLPGVIQRYQREWPNIDFEIMIGDYAQIEQWLHKGRIDIGFLIYPTLTELDFTPLISDRLLIVLPWDHPLAGADKFPVSAIADDPFIMLQQGAQSEIVRWLETVGITPRVRFVTIDDYAIMSMVERGLGISMLPELILKRAPYRIVRKEPNVPARRTIGFAVRDREKAPKPVSRFLELLDIDDWYMGSVPET